MDKERIKSTPLVSRDDIIKDLGFDGQVENLRETEFLADQRRRAENRKFRLDVARAKKIVTVVLTGSLIASTIGAAKYVSNKIEEANSEIRYVAGVPDEFDGTLNIKVFVQADGTAYYEDENGIRTGKLNGIPAATMAEMTGYQEEPSDTISGIKR